MAIKLRTWRVALLAGCATAALATALPAAAAAEGPAREYAIGSQDLDSALRAFAMTSGHDVVFDPALVRGRMTAGVNGAVSDEAALRTLLEGTELAFEQTPSGGFVVRAPRFRAAEAEAEGGTVEALIVTAQKREEDIQDVPIAISAFTQETLERSQIAGGPDLMTQVPNMTFTKTNFSSYSIQIRGIGTQAISATTDPAVAVAFNNTPFIRNRFFEQEFYDLQRVEVLRGPQGTLYGRNATAGVVNIISQKPKFNYEAKLSGDVSNYNSTRLEGMVNIPLAEDTIALRLAGAWTKRDGFVTNEITGNPIDGRDLWSTRVSLRIAPTDRLDMNLIWEHFEEDDDRLRSGKQTCKKDIVTEIAGFPVSPNAGGSITGGFQGAFTQGCAPSSLYSPDSFETPNGWRLPFYNPLGAIFLATANPPHDPYVSAFQSQDLRVIESTVDPHYRADTDLVEFQLSFDITDNLTFQSETAYLNDFIFSTQDFNRFNTAPGAWDATAQFELEHDVLDENGVFCDPQIGCADRLVGVDLSTAKSKHFSQEFRLGSDFDGPFNFSLGANFLKYDTEDKYYVFINALTLFAAGQGQSRAVPDNYVYDPRTTTNIECMRAGYQPPRPDYLEQVQGCIYIDPNPIDNLNDLGHNYFLSRNPFSLLSYAVFGEAYYNITDTLKVTAGLRYTVDQKNAPRIPSWTLAARTVGYPVANVVEQEWREPTGRLAIDWKPDLAFTDETMIYGSYAHGYKGGGANPPAAGIVLYAADVQERANLVQGEATKPRTFEPEFVDAFELGAKNTLADGRVTLNLAAFYYDYKDYQISYIVDRSAVNLNFDSEVWGLEIEADWRPLENLRLGFKGGYENTKVGDGERAIDTMDRTNGDPNWVLVTPFPTFTNNCIMPIETAVFGNPPSLHIPGDIGNDLHLACERLWLLNTYPGFDRADYPEANNGEGIFKDLSGNELPNAPHFTATITADYTVPLPNEWLATLHTDLYYQSEAWTRIFNMEGYDKLKAYTNVNLAAIFTNEDAGWKVMAYVKNVFDRDSITGAFLISDDTGLPTNVFLTEPRLYGLRVTKDWRGGPLLGSFGSRHDGPYPFTVELGGQVQRHDAPNETLLPSFADSFSPGIEPFSDQEEDLDWGDGREIKLTYRTPTGWLASLAGRWGKTNGGGKNWRYETDPEVQLCIFNPSYFCSYYGFPLYEFPETSYATTYEREEHLVVDFAVGREVGMGALSASTVSAGLRYAQFKSRTSLDMDGMTNWEGYASESFKYKNVAWHDRYQAMFEADREFEGAGPVVSWEAAKALWTGDRAGRLDVDWSISGGALFGKQKMDGAGEEISAYYSAENFYFENFTVLDGPDTTTIEIEPRSKSVTVPTFGASLGLSYSAGPMRIGAGYRWERYFDVIDGGFEERREEDRTIDGPYFKIAVGFGGG